MQSMKIISMGKAIPPELTTSTSLDIARGKPLGYTLAKSGILSRNFSPTTLLQSELAASALKDAIQSAGIPSSSIDLLISACGVQEQALPSTACAIAEKVGLKEGTPAFDVNASCLSFMVALNVATSLLNSGQYSRIAVVSADQPSKGLNWDDPESSLIFGDGAAAAIIERGGVAQGIKAFSFKTYPEGRRLCEIRAGGTLRNPTVGADSIDYLFNMNGKQVLKLALQKLPDFLQDLYISAGISRDTISVVVPHQASHLGMAHVIKKLGIPEESVINIYPTHGNQVAASIPTALYEALSTGKLKEGGRCLLLGTAAGLSIGGLILDV